MTASPDHHACRPAIALLAAALLTACAPAAVPGAAPPIAQADPSDACGRQVANLDAARGLFAGSVIAGAAIGAGAGSLLLLRPGGIGAVPGSVAVIGGLAAGALAGAAVGDYLERRRREARDEAALAEVVGADLARENENLDLARNAAEFLLDCRLRRAQDTREALREGTLPRPEAEARLAALQAAAGRDAALARQIEERIRARDAEFRPAIEALDPGGRAAAEALSPAAAPPVPATAALPLTLRARPDSTAVAVAEVPAGQRVQLRAAREPDFVAVEAPDGRRLGYVPAAAFGAAAPRAAGAAAAPAAPLRRLAATNIARQDGFSETVQDMTRAAAGEGFEPGI